VIKFDLEKALAGDKVVTRDGREVTQLVNFVVMTDRSLCGVLDKELCTWLIDGSRYVSGVPVENYRLFMAPKKLSGFVNVYDDGRHGTVHKTKTAADEWAEDMPRDCIRLTCIDLSQFEEAHNEQVQ